MTPADPTREDPFFRVLRRRHPDIDLVVLPPREEGPVAGAPAFPAQALAVQRHAERALAALWERVGVRPTTSSAHWWAQDRPDVHRHVARATVTGLAAGDVVPLCRDLGDALLALGWDARPAPGPVPAIRARVATLDLSVRSGEGTVAVEVVSAPMVLTAETLAVLEEGR